MSVITLVLVSADERVDPELSRGLGGLPVRVVTAQEALGEPFTLKEEAGTLRDAATRGASRVRDVTGMLTVGEAAGLEVDALGGRPGVRSERFAHDRATDAENNAALLRELEEVDETDRTARFRCVMAVASPWGNREMTVVEGLAEGHVARTPSGSGGFGYEPLFVSAEGGNRPLSELDEEEKRRLSARARAVEKLRMEIARVLDEMLTEAERIAG